MHSHQQDVETEDRSGVADDPTTHVVPFYVHCVNCFMGWFHV